MIELPQGRYLSCAFAVDADAMGQTRALLMRNRFLAREAGVRPTVLAFGAAPDYEERRRVLLERGLLSEHVSLLCIYDHYREHGWGDAEPAGELEDLLGGRKVAEDPWRIAYRLPEGRLVYDYLRADGTPYLRIPQFGTADKASWRATIHRIGPDGAPVGEFGSVGQWFRHFIRELAGAERTFVFLDSRFLVPYLVPLRKRRIHVLYQMHNMHLEPPRRWDSALHPVYRRVLARIDDMDAIVNLTERQRDDIAARRGRTTTCSSSPTRSTCRPAAAPRPQRDPNRVVTMARLETQKRLMHAITAFARVVEAVPEARLDIYGEGSQRAKLAERDRALRATGSVTLHGYDPHAREALWTASAFLMTSEYEGYPLSTLEAMSQGCPVVSYDIRYGPREQIDDGADGFVVPEGDEAALADRVIELLRSPELVQRMSAAAREKVARYGPAEFVERWAQVIRAAVELEPDRTRIDEAAFELTRLRERRGTLELRGVLRVEGRGTPRRRAAAARRRARRAARSSSCRSRSSASRAGSASPRGSRSTTRCRPRASLALRLRLTWHNSAWETEIAQPPDGVAVSIGAGGVVQLVR